MILSALFNISIRTLQQLRDKLHIRLYEASFEDSFVCLTYEQKVDVLKLKNTLPDEIEAIDQVIRVLKKYKNLP